MGRIIDILYLDPGCGGSAIFTDVLQRAGWKPRWQCVGDEREFLRCAADGHFDLLLACANEESTDLLKQLNHIAERPPLLLLIRSGNLLDWLPLLDQGVADIVEVDRPLRLALAVHSALHKTHHPGISAEQAEQFRLQSAGLECAANAIVITDLSGSINWVNPAFSTLTGYSAGEIIGKSASILNSGKHPRRFFREMWECILSGGTWRGEIVNRHKSGHLYTEEMIITPIRDARGNICNFVAIKQDVSDRKRIQENLENAHRETERLLASISSVLIGVDENDTITRWNAIAEEIFAIPAAAVVGKPFLHCGIDWNWREVLNHIAGCRDADHPTHWDDIRYKTPAGKDGFLRITVNPILSESRQFAGFLMLASEVTERKMLESQLTQAQKLESIGQLGAGIAHEINTPIQYVGDNIRFIHDSFKDLAALIGAYGQLRQACVSGADTSGHCAETARLEKAIDLEYLLQEIPLATRQSLDGVARIASIVMAMKEFSHPGYDEKKLTDINKSLESTITVSRNEWKYVAEMQTDFDPDLPAVPCLPAELNQVFLNMIINAAHAIAELVDRQAGQKGVITVRTRCDGEWVRISISDTGTGIPESIRSKIFDPFFTTKPVGKGTGQGLAISHNVVVDKHQGTIQLETQPGIGTTFTICLPVNPPATTTSAHAPAGKNMQEQKIESQ